MNGRKTPDNCCTKRIRRCPYISGYFLIRNFFFPDSKISTSARIRIQIEFACPHVSDRYSDSLQYPGLLWEYWQQSMRRGCHLEYSIHGKELGSILLRHRIKKYPDLASARFRIHSVFKNFHSEFVCRIHRIRVDRSSVRKELFAV